MGEEANGWGDPAGHEAGAAGAGEERVFGLAAEWEVGDAAGGGVAADAVPAIAAVVAGPGSEDAEIGLCERVSDRHQRRPIGGVAHGGAALGGGNGEGDEKEE